MNEGGGSAKVVGAGEAKVLEARVLEVRLAEMREEAMVVEASEDVRIEEAIR